MARAVIFEALAAAALGGYLALPSVEFRNGHAFDQEIRLASNKYGISFYLIKGMIATESAFDSNAQATTSSALGLMQVTKPTAESMGYNHSAMLIPAVAIDAGARYLHSQIKKFGLIDGVRAYYAGPGTVGKVIAGRFGELSEAQQRHYRESRDYSNKVFAYALAFMAKGG